MNSLKQQILSTRAFGKKVSDYSSPDQSLVMYDEKAAKLHVVMAGYDEDKLQ